MGAYAFVKTMCCILCIHSANAAPPTFTSPLPTGGSSSMAETKTGGGVVIGLQANDPDGDPPTFSIASQTPSSPVFTIDGSDRVVVPSGGVDYETTTSFNFIFRVTAGGETATTTYVLTITNVDDESPVFTNAAYTKNITETAASGTTLVTVTATDVDSSSVSYSIAGAQTAFGINVAGVVTVADQTQLTGLKPTVILTLQANDGTNPSGTASLTINISDGPCTPNPCQSSGNCSSSGGTTYSCTCTPQYTGPQCQYANLCYISPCQNRASCTPMNNDYMCHCTRCFDSKNCTNYTNKECNSRSCVPASTSKNDTCNCSALDGNQEDCQCKDCHIATICCCLCLFVFGTVGLIYCWLKCRSWQRGGQNTEKPQTLRKWLSEGCPSEKPNSGIPCLKTCFRCLDSKQLSICGTVIFIFTMTGLIFLMYISGGLICLIFCSCNGSTESSRDMPEKSLENNEGRCRKKNVVDNGHEMETGEIMKKKKKKKKIREQSELESDYPVGTRRLEPLPKSQPPVSYRRPLPDISK